MSTVVCYQRNLKVSSTSGTAACNGVTDNSNYMDTSGSLVGASRIWGSSTCLGSPNSGNNYYSDTSFFGTVSGTVFTWQGSCSSDRRLKKNIKLIGKSKSGLNIYTFRYIKSLNTLGLFQGVMAQELLGTKFENAAIMNANGYYSVDYTKIDVISKKIKD